MSLVLNNLMVKLTREQVEAFLKEAIEKSNPGYTVSQVVVNVTAQYEDLRGYSYGHTLSGFEIHLERNDL